MLHHGIYVAGHYSRLRLDPRGMEQPELLAPTREGLANLLRGPGDAGRRAIERVFLGHQVQALPEQGEAHRWLIRTAAQEIWEVKVEGLQVTSPFPEGYPPTVESLAMLLGYLHTAAT
jgi:hypothetical protein